MLVRHLAGAGVAAMALCAAACDDELVFMNDESGGSDYAASGTAAQPLVTAQRVDDPSTPADDPERNDLTSLQTVAEPSQTLLSADVRDRGGSVIGAVSTVQTAPGGAIEQIVVALDEGRTVAVSPTDARYRPEDGSVVLVVPVEQLKP